MLDPGRNCWRIERAGRAALIVDACDYFHLVRRAMMAAEKQILLIGWDFDTRILLDHEDGDDAPPTLGSFISWLARHRPQVKVHILRWDWGATKLLARGTTLFRLINWARTPQIKFKLDGAHPPGASHHQKIVVIDDRLAFCGGIDMTATRWDTREHRDGDKRRRRPTTGRHYRPWHDSTMAVDGAAAQALGELARDRWKTAGGDPIEAPKVDSDPWPDALEPQFQDVEVAIARTRGEHKDASEVREIEALFLDVVARARRYFYAENQFFASRVVAEAICERLQEAEGPEFVILNPKIVEGWVEEEVMSPARAKLLQMLWKADRHGRLRVYTPVTASGCDIYVHSKITIVDGELLRVGSANLNNRSMGLDSECDLLIDCGRAANAGASSRIGAILCDLLAEHLGVAPNDVRSRFEATGSLVATIEELRGRGRTLVPLHIEEPNALEAAIAEREALDPERPGEYFEPTARRGLLRRLRSLVSRT
ncbi:phospholipase D-like domain-containing protein [Sphingomonas sp.]|uniref:phospholipase D-like domain-containing protein n=1 Tax=Sphingomonas sp. TaxID=28214 RepID=UPI0025F4F2C7|nr:phospholipase D-like domain-containing protein [Sphingomonas sp.]